MSTGYQDSDFQTVFFDDFSGNSIDRSIWRTLYGGDYGNGMFSWDHGQLSVGDGKLTISTENVGDGWLSGGLSTIPDGQTYGRYEFRARFDEGQGTSGVALLWPSNNEWTDEINIIETHRGDRKEFAFTNHGEPNETQYIKHDLTDWHTYTLDWLPDQLVLSIDGEEVARMTHDIPDQPMSFGLQGQVTAAWEDWFGGAPDGTTPDRVDIEVDWVHALSWEPGAGSDDYASNGGATGTATGGSPGKEAADKVAQDDGAEDDQDDGVQDDGSWDAAENGDDSWEDDSWQDASSGDDAGEDASWNDASGDDPFSAFQMDDGGIDWNALAAHVTANYEATGQWFI